MVPKEITNGVYIVGRANAQDKNGCNAYLLDFGELVIIDAGTGTRVPL